MRILIVEDEPKLLGFLKQGLEEQRYAVDTAQTGEDGLHWALNFPYDIMILDVMLPGIDGLELCQVLRNRRIQTPILMLTARDTVDDRVAGLDRGADDYLIKPFAFRELLARLRALARRDTPHASATLQIGDLHLDTVTHSARRGDRHIELSAKEYELLEFLILHPKQVLSRTVIAEHIWNYDYSPESNVVDVYIRYLRRKIDDGYEDKYIRTIRGTGYQLVDPDYA
ncbi:MAG: response regulator transcription factor [Chitinophagaceae bacterium]|nr:response regulator transcription factor [Anaerolineae bacterium]